MNLQIQRFSSLWIKVGYPSKQLDSEPLSVRTQHRNVFSFYNTKTTFPICFQNTIKNLKTFFGELNNLNNRLFALLLLLRNCVQGRRNSARSGGQWKSRGQWKLIKNKRNVTNYACFCSATMLTYKMWTEIMENHSAFSGFANTCNKCVSSRRL